MSKNKREKKKKLKGEGSENALERKEAARYCCVTSVYACVCVCVVVLFAAAHILIRANEIERAHILCISLGYINN